MQVNHCLVKFLPIQLFNWILIIPLGQTHGFARQSNAACNVPAAFGKHLLCYMRKLFARGLYAKNAIKQIKASPAGLELLRKARLVHEHGRLNIQV